MKTGKKLNLETLKIQSFVTSVSQTSRELEGGRDCGVTLCPPCTPANCPTNDFPCFTKRTYCDPCEIEAQPY